MNEIFLFFRSKKVFFLEKKPGNPTIRQKDRKNQCYDKAKARTKAIFVRKPKIH